MRAKSAPNSFWKVLIAAVIAVGLLVCFAPDDAYAGSLSADTSGAVKKVRMQTTLGSSHSSCCACIACAYGDYVTGITNRSHTYYNCGSCNWSGWSGHSGSLASIKSEIDSKHPVVLHVVNNSSWGTPGSQHWVLVVGYSGSCANMSNLTVLDPYDGKVITASQRYNQHSDKRFYTTSRAVPSAHTHSYSKVVSYSYKSYNSHTVKKKCSCGATKTETESCTFTTSDDTRKCSKCGKAAQIYGNNKATTVTKGFYFIRPMTNNNLAVDVYDGSASSGANVWLASLNKNASQQFILAPNNNGTYSLQYYPAQGSGKLIGVKGWSVSYGGNVQIEDFCLAHMNKQWYIEKTPDGYYSFRNKYSNLYLDICNGSVKNRTNLQQCNGNGTAAQKFSLTRVSVSDASITGISDKAYTGNPIKQSVSVKIGVNVVLQEGRDYSVSYSENVRPGTAKVTIAGRGNYTGSVTKTFTITGSSLSGASVAGLNSRVYTGKPITPNPVVKLGGRQLKVGSDYAVSYSNNVNVGTAKVTITGKGKYTGSITKTFAINKASATMKYSSSKLSKTYGSSVKNALTKKTDGKITYKSSNTKVATVNSSGKVTIKGIGKATITAKAAAGANYKQSSTSYVLTVNPKGTSVSKTTAAKKAFTVSWKKQTTQTTGYQIRYSTKSNMSGSKTITVSKNSKTSQKVSSLKAKTKYYVQVRTYKTVNGTKYYSGWSSAKSVKTK